MAPKKEETNQQRMYRETCHEAAKMMKELVKEVQAEQQSKKKEK